MVAITLAGYEQAAATLPEAPSAPANSGSLEVALHRGGPEVIQHHADAWRTLCGRAAPEMAFLRPELVSAYFDAFAPNDPVVLLTVRRAGELVALLPLHEKSAGVGPFHIHWLRSAANVYFPRFDALYADADPDLIAELFFQALQGDYAYYLLHLEMVKTDGVVARMRELAARDGKIARTADPNESPYITVPVATVSREDVIAAQGRKLRSTLRRSLRRLEARGTLRSVHVNVNAEGKDITEWLALFCDLEHRGWKGEAGTSISSNAATGQFYQSLARDEDLRPNVRCLALMLGDEMIAADIALEFGKTRFGMKSAINEEYRDCAPGHLLILHLLMECSRSGATELDLGGVADSYKLHWTDTTRPFASVFIFPEGLRGRLLHTAVFDIALRAKDYLRSKPLAHRVRCILRRLPLA